MSLTLTIDGDQLCRLVKICKLIGNGRPATFDKLQRKMKASRRTIFRDFKDLAKMGIKYKLDGRGYRIPQKPLACRKLIVAHQVKAVNRLLAKCV